MRSLIIILIACFFCYGFGIFVGYYIWEADDKSQESRYTIVNDSYSVVDITVRDTGGSENWTVILRNEP